MRGNKQPMTFHSILFPNPPPEGPDEQLAAPTFFGDLNLDQIVAAITAGREEYNLKPFFHLPLQDVDAVTFRHEVMQDLEVTSLFDSIKVFAQGLRTMREHLAQAEKLHYQLQKQRWFLDAVDTYCDAVTRLVQDLSVADLTSRGFLAFREWVSRYAASAPFTSLVEQTKKLEADLRTIHYGVWIRDLRIQVHRYGGEPDYSDEIEATFDRFKQGAAKDYRFKFLESAEMNHVEAEILRLVSQLYAEIFAELENYCAANRDYQDSTVVRFDREVQFYVAYLEHIARFKNAGLSFCYPRVSQSSKEVYDYEGFDLALAGKLVPQNGSIVCNDFHLRGPERMIVVSGPNQGGKTTFARMFGQLHYLGSLGCPVPGKRAQVFLFDQLFTHFEKQEDIKNLRGKLQDDLVRVHQIVERATSDSIVIMNEIFTSATLRDAVVLSSKIAMRLLTLDLLCLWVTFVDELASLTPQTVSMVSTVHPENPALRTYKVIRRPADGLAYAMAIAEKYRLSYPLIKERTGA
jgi:DNA mismatch repair protein MutS